MIVLLIFGTVTTHFPNPGPVTDGPHTGPKPWLVYEGGRSWLQTVTGSANEEVTFGRLDAIARGIRSWWAALVGVQKLREKCGWARGSSY